MLRILKFRYRHLRYSIIIIKGFLRNSAESTGKHLRRSLVFNKVAGRITEHLRAAGSVNRGEDVDLHEYSSQVIAGSE